MTGKTYQEWQDLGYHVRRGQKATGRNSGGKATFTIDQVSIYYDDPADYEYEDDWMFIDPVLGDR